MSRDKKTKKILEAHAKAAAEERYGIVLNKEARREIVQKIQTGEADFVSRTSNNRTLWKVDHQETSLNVVYDKARHALCTVLPKTALEFQTPQAEVSCSVTPTTTTPTTQPTSSGCIECPDNPCSCPGNWSDWSDK
jgi:hypothetical protein